MEAAVADLAGKGERPLTVLKIDRPVEVSQGAGMGDLLDIDEGRRRLTAYAVPSRIEDWAGPVAGPVEIEKMFGTKRSTLHDWQKRGAVIGLLKGERKHVFPLAQFVDGRPVKGMSDVTRIIGNPRTACPRHGRGETCSTAIHGRNRLYRRCLTQTKEGNGNARCGIGGRGHRGDQRL